MAPPPLTPSAIAPFGLSPILNTSFTDVDFTHCSRYYSYPRVPALNDCLMAVSQLPAGNKPVTWYNTHEADVDPKYTLPIVQTR
ncbi:MAG: hypothetical protein Q9181_008061, partial [Wetmoreana brouardii]